MNTEIPDFIAPPLWSTVLFLGVIFGVQGMLLFAIHRAHGRRGVMVGGLAFVVVLVGTALLARSGLLRAGGMPPRVLLYFGATNLGALALALTSPGRALASAVPAAFWLLFQGFRLPLEVALHAFGTAGTIPPQMTWSGENLDVITGVVSLALGAVLLLRPRLKAAGWLGHAVGIALLANVARVALLSAPTPFKSFEGPPLQLPLHVPYTWIVPFAVAAALFGHVVGLRSLRLRIP